MALTTIWALLHISRGRADAAIQSFERAIELNPSAAMAYAQLGRALLRKGRNPEALEHFHYAMRLSPRDPLLPYWLAFAGSGALDQGNYDKAIEYLDRAVMLAPGHPRMTLALIAAHAQAGHVDEARRQLEQLQKAQPHITPETLIERFYGPESRNRNSQLRQGFQRALAVLGDSWKSPPLSSAPGLPDGAAKEIVAIAVLPFTSYGETGEPSRFADMMTDDLTNMLSRVSGFRVISRNTAETYRNQRIDAATVGAELGVRYLLEGRVSMRDNYLRVNVELTNTKTRLHAWSGRFELAGTNPDRVQAGDRQQHRPRIAGRGHAHRGRGRRSGAERAPALAEGVARAQPAASRRCRRCKRRSNISPRSWNAIRTHPARPSGSQRFTSIRCSMRRRPIPRRIWQRRKRCSGR